MIAIIDYGAGESFQCEKCLDYLQIENCVTEKAEIIRRADGLILPGVGAFPDAMERLERKQLVSVIQEEAARKPLLGICLGMQLLFEESWEFKKTKGLGLIPGKVNQNRWKRGKNSPYGLESSGGIKTLQYDGRNGGKQLCVFCSFLQSGYRA